MNSSDKSLDKSIVKILRAGNDAQIHFPAVHLNQQKAVEFTLTNQSDTYVNWRAFSMAPAYLKDEDNTTFKSNHSTFNITPKSGIIPPRQKQAINVEFCPRDAIGVFTQIFTLETRADLVDKENIEQLSYSCQLVLTGQSVSQNRQKAAKVAHSLDNFAVKKELESIGSDIQSFMKDHLPGMNYSSLSSSSTTNTSSLMTATISSSNLSTVSNTGRKIAIKEDIILFEETRPNEITKSSLTIHNKDNTDCKITVINLMNPFFTKHPSLMINNRHYVKIPIEFRPRVPGDYKDNILIRVDGHETLLSCVIKGKCVS